MEELGPEELEKLVQELEVESEEGEQPSPGVEKLLQDLERERPMELKVEAVRQLGELSKSNRQIVEALAAACMWDASPQLRKLAAASLLAPAHQAVIEQHPGLLPQHVKNLWREIEEGGLEEAIVEPEVMEEGLDEAPPMRIDALLHALRHDSLFRARASAAERLGQVDESNLEIVESLLAAQDSDPFYAVRTAAAEALRAPVHQMILQEHLDLIRGESPPRDLEELAREPEEEALPAEVHDLLRALQPAKLYTSRRRAAEQLGEVGRSNREVVLALLVTAETDASAEVRATAARSLRAPAHQALLQQYPELEERAQAVLERTAVAREKDLQWDRPDETDTGQSRLAYRLAAAVLLLTVALNVVDKAAAWALNIQSEMGLCQMLPMVIDVGLAIGLLQLRRGARTWVLIRAGVGAILWPILLFVGNDPVTATIMSVMQWGFCGALLLLLTGQSKTWRLALAVGIYVVFTLGLFAVLMLLVLLASAL